MALKSGLVPLGTPASAFDLPDTAGQRHQLSDYDDQVLVVAFVCNHCPYVRHIESALGQLASTSTARFLAVCSNDAENYPDDAPPGLIEQAKRAGWKFPYLVDAEQDVARSYGAVCTPDFCPRPRLAPRLHCGSPVSSTASAPTPAQCTSA